VRGEGFFFLLTQEWKQALDNIAYMERRLAALLAQIDARVEELAAVKRKDRGAAFLALERGERDQVARRIERGLLQEAILPLGPKLVRQLRRELTELDAQPDEVCAPCCARVRLAGAAVLRLA
jgi:hypothetical protein